MRGGGRVVHAEQSFLHVLAVLPLNWHVYSFEASLRTHTHCDVSNFAQ